MGQEGSSDKLGPTRHFHVSGLTPNSALHFHLANLTDANPVGKGILGKAVLS